MAQGVLRKSKREEFGLIVAEAMWKGTPVIASRVGGIPLQPRDGRDGHLVDSTEATAEKVTHPLLDPAERSRMGAEGREQVRSNFRMTRNLLDYLALFTELSHS